MRPTSSAEPRVYGRRGAAKRASRAGIDRRAWCSSYPQERLKPQRRIPAQQTARLKICTTPTSPQLSDGYIRTRCPVSNANTAGKTRHGGPRHGLSSHEKGATGWLAPPHGLWDSATPGRPQRSPRVRAVSPPRWPEQSRSTAAVPPIELCRHTSTTYAQAALPTWLPSCSRVRCGFCVVFAGRQVAFWK
jgi:hypothetical protein